MKISTAGIEFIKKFEGLCLQAYLCPAGVWTIGFGSTQISGRGVTPKDVISKEIAEILLKNDLMRFEKIVNERDNIYFLFINTPIFYQHPRIIYLPKIVSHVCNNK